MRRMRGNISLRNGAQCFALARIFCWCPPFSLLPRPCPLPSANFSMFQTTGKAWLVKREWQGVMRGCFSLRPCSQADSW